MIGGCQLRRLPLTEDAVELAWQIGAAHGEQGYATEAGRAVAEWLFRHDVPEIFSVAWPRNTGAIATARRVGMHWICQDSKYYRVILDLYRLRPADLHDAP